MGAFLLYIEFIVRIRGCIFKNVKGCYYNRLRWWKWV